ILRPFASGRLLSRLLVPTWRRIWPSGCSEFGRRMMLRKVLAIALGAVLLSGAAMAQNYPGRTITMIIPFAAGGPTDTVGRLIADAMGKDLGQTIVVENVNGAGGTLGAARVATAAPDGYTILLHHIGIAAADTLYRKLPYKTLDAFEYVGLVTD